MNFFRKLFPLYQKKSMAQDTNVNNINNISTYIEVSIDPYPSRIDVMNLNVMESDHENAELDDSSVTNTMFDDDIDSDKILCTLENVTPIEISLNSDTSKELEEIIVTHDVNPEDVNEFTYNSEVSTIKKETSHNLNNINDELTGIELLNDVISNEAEVLNGIICNSETSTVKNIVDNETLQNLREFEETLNNVAKTARITDDSGGEPINLDEFYEMIDKLDTVYEETNSQNGSVRSIFEHNRERTIDSNKVDERSEHVVNSERNPLENIDIISINSSTEDEKSQTNNLHGMFTNSCSGDQESECEGYNSSDFEFISEAEANNMDGFLINFSKENHPNSSQVSSHLSTVSGQNIDVFEDQDIEKEHSDPGEGPSGLKRPKNLFEDRRYRDNHVVPVGDDYLGLFQGIYNPSLPLCEIYFMENKSVRASAMNIQYDGIGFDKQLALRRHQPDSSEEEFEDEAKESAKRILNMYPGENRKRRRRY